MRDEPVTSLLRQCVDLEDLDFALDHGPVAGAAQPSRTARVAAKFLPVGLSVGVAISSASPSQPKDSGTRIRRTVRRGTGRPDIDVVGEPMLSVATTLNAGAGVGTYRS